MNPIGVRDGGQRGGPGRAEQGGDDRDEGGRRRDQEREPDPVHERRGRGVAAVRGEDGGEDRDPEQPSRDVTKAPIDARISVAAVLARPPAPLAIGTAFSVDIAVFP